jgi:hypothetical protein
MRTIFPALVIACAVSSASPALAQQPPLLSQALPMSGDLDVQTVKYVLPPVGHNPTTTAAQPGHSRPGAACAHVIKDEVNSCLGKGPEKTFKAGDTRSEQPGEAHFIANASRTEPAEVLVIFVLPRGAANTGRRRNSGGSTPAPIPWIVASQQAEDLCPTGPPQNQPV